MVIGYVLLSIAAGLIGFVASLFFGASFWSAFGVYTLVGFTSMIVMPVVHAVSSKLADRTSLKTDADHWTATDTANKAKPETPQTNLSAKPVFTVLAVDDEPFTLELVEIIAASAGDFRIVTATSGDEALDYIMNIDQSFDYLLFDINMPGMSGIDLCRQVRQMLRYRDVPIVMLTALRDMKNMDEAFRAGATDYATKPFEVDELCKRFQMAHEWFKSHDDTNTAHHNAARYAAELQGKSMATRSGGLGNTKAMSAHIKHVDTWQEAKRIAR